MDVYNTLVRFYQEGGAFMHPILAVMAVGLAIAIERFIYLSLTRRNNRRTWDALQPLIQTGRLREAQSLCDKSDTAVGRIVGYGLGRMNVTDDRADIEYAMEEGLMEAVPRLERRTPYLATLANIATLLGLLGTIIGLISAFGAISLANPNEKAQLLSSSISVAMNTTAFGLIVGIPLLLIHAMLQTRTRQIVDSLEMATVKVLNCAKERVPLKEVA